MPDKGSMALTDKHRSYNPEQTAEVRRATINAIVSSQAELLERASERTDMNDLCAVQRITNECMQKCGEIGVLPNMELLAASLGMGRQTLYDYIHKNPYSKTTEYLDRVRTAWASMRQMAADRGAVDVTHTIFVLLNSSLGFTNQHQIEISQADNPAWAGRDPEEIRRQYRESLPE